MNTTIDGLKYDTNQVLKDSKEKETTMALTMEEKNRKRREARTNLKLVPTTEAGPKATKTAKANGKIEQPKAIEAVKVEIKTPAVKAKASDQAEDIAIPDFLDRNNPDNEKKAVAARDKHAEEVRNRPVITLKTSTPAAAPTPMKKGKAKGEKKMTLFRKIKLLVVADPNISNEALIKQLKAEGFSNANPSTVSTTRNNTRDTMKLIQEKWGGDFKLI